MSLLPQPLALTPKKTVNVSEYAFKAGQKSLPITDSKISPLAGTSDVCFDIKEAEVIGVSAPSPLQ